MAEPWIKINGAEFSADVQRAAGVIESMMISNGNTKGSFAAHAKQQATYAVAVALTTTAQQAKVALVESLAGTFQIRNTWVEKGIRVNWATKYTLTATVGSRDRSMVLQAEGGEKTGKGGNDVAVPVLGTARKTTASITRPSRWPGKLLLDKKRFFLKPLGGGHVGVFRRLGKGGRVGVQLWYVLAHDVKVKPKWHFEEIVKRVVRANLARNVADGLAEAMRTGFGPMLKRQR